MVVLVESFVAGLAHSHFALDAELRDDGALRRTLAAEDLAAVPAVVLQTRVEWAMLGENTHKLTSLFRPSATVSRIGLMESRTCGRCCCRSGQPPPHHHHPPAWHDVMDGWGTRPLR